MCPTPIGNLADVTVRVLRTLASVDVILAEDTRHTRKLLAHYAIDRPLRSFYREVESERQARCLEEIRQGCTLALVSDAGMPGLADPGEDLVRACRRAGLHVEVLPGPSAPVTALVGSGLPTLPHLFLGFLPRGQSAVRRAWQAVASFRGTVLAFESARRLPLSLRLAAEVLGPCPGVIARELSKIHEEYRAASLPELADYYGAHQGRGEIVVLIDTRHAERAEVAAVASGAGSMAQQAKQLAQLEGLSRKQAYQRLLEKKEAPCEGSRENF